MFETIRTLSEVPGPSGFEQAAAEQAGRRLEPLEDRAEQTAHDNMFRRLTKHGA